MTAFTSCRNDKPNADYLASQPLLLSAPEQSRIIVIPGSGCPGCISEKEEYAVSHVDKDSVYFVFTRIQSMKLFRQKFNGLLNAKNVILDTAGQFNFPEEKEDIYPMTYQKMGGKFVLQKN